jgi:hypothetical protein
MNPGNMRPFVWGVFAGASTRVFFEEDGGSWGLAWRVEVQIIRET